MLFAALNVIPKSEHGTAVTKFVVPSAQLEYFSLHHVDAHVFAIYDSEPSDLLSSHGATYAFLPTNPDVNHDADTSEKHKKQVKKHRTRFIFFLPLWLFLQTKTTKYGGREVRKIINTNDPDGLWVVPVV